MYLCIQNILFQIFIKNVERKNKLLPQFTSVLQEPKSLEFDNWGKHWMYDFLCVECIVFGHPGNHHVLQCSGIGKLLSPNM